MTRKANTQKIKTILKDTSFSVRQRGGRYIFERTANDDKFIPDFQILPTFDSAVRWARSIKALYI